MERTHKKAAVCQARAQPEMKKAHAIWSRSVLWEYFHLGFWLSASGYTGNNASVRQVGIFSVYWNHFVCLSVCPPVDVSEFVLLISPELLNVF